MEATLINAIAASATGLNRPARLDLVAAAVMSDPAAPKSPGADDDEGAAVKMELVLIVMFRAGLRPRGRA